MQIIFNFYRLRSTKYPLVYGIEEMDLPEIDCTMLKDVVTAIKRYNVPWFKLLSADAHF
jgi:hypothetical protein